MPHIARHRCDQLPKHGNQFFTNVLPMQFGVLILVEMEIISTVDTQSFIKIVGQLTSGINKRGFFKPLLERQKPMSAVVITIGTEGKHLRFFESALARIGDPSVKKT